MLLWVYLNLNVIFLVGKRILSALSALLRYIVYFNRGTGFQVVFNLAGKPVLAPGGAGRVNERFPPGFRNGSIN